METNNHTEWHSERLQRRLDELTAIDQPWQSEERRRHIRTEIGRIVREQVARYAEEHAASVAESWKEYGEL